MDRFLEQLAAAAGRDRVKTEEKMKNHVTFRAGGPADYFVSPENEASLAAVLRLCRESGMPYTILGNGSNLLVSDAGYRGVIVELGKAWSYCYIDGCRVRAGAGTLLSSIARTALSHGLTGFEAAGGIPGSLGGAVVMNAGAYGFEMKDVLCSVRVMDQEGGVRELSLEELDLGYRRSAIQPNHYTVLEANLELREGKPEEIRALMEELAARRREKQPLEYPSAGSTFKRPAGYFAGKLIQDAGLRGCRIGGAQVSEKHCGFVINRDHATAADIINLCRHVQREVREQFGVDMEMEVKLLGDFEEQAARS